MERLVGDLTNEIKTITNQILKVTAHIREVREKDIRRFSGTGGTIGELWQTETTAKALGRRKDALNREMKERISQKQTLSFSLARQKNRLSALEKDIKKLEIHRDRWLSERDARKRRQEQAEEDDIGSVLFRRKSEDNP